MFASAAERSDSLIGEGLPRLSHFDELVVLVAAFHLFGERTALFGVLKILVLLLHGDASEIYPWPCRVKSCPPEKPLVRPCLLGAP